VAAAVPDGTDLFDASPEEEDATARRLVFSPGRSTALPIPAVRRQSQQGQQAPQAQQVPTGGEAEPGLGAAELEVAPAWLQGRRQAAAGALQPPRSCSGTFLALHGGNGGALVAPRLSCDVLRASDAALPGASSGVASLADASLAPQLERVLWVPPALLGTWQRDDGASLDAGGLAGVHALLRMPPLQAAAWEQTRELQVGRRLRALLAPADASGWPAFLPCNLLLPCLSCLAPLTLIRLPPPPPPRPDQRLGRQAAASVDHPAAQRQSDPPTT
jgi:hypothetical protein